MFNTHLYCTEYLRQELLAGFIGLQLVNVLHKDALVLEDVTLGPQVEAVVPETAGEETSISQSSKHKQLQQICNAHVPVNLLGLPVAAQQTAQDPHAAHPGQLLRHAGVGRTLSLTWSKESFHHFTFQQF